MKNQEVWRWVGNEFSFPLVWNYFVIIVIIIIIILGKEAALNYNFWKRFGANMQI